MFILIWFWGGIPQFGSGAETKIGGRKGPGAKNTREKTPPHLKFSTTKMSPKIKTMDGNPAKKSVDSDSGF